MSDKLREAVLILAKKLGLKKIPDVTLITRDAVELWWDELTPDQQKARGSNFRKCFNFLMKKKL
ncbi:MAG: hypothetical protein ACKVK1_02475, partial [Flavobacteriales bacterium]